MKDGHAFTFGGIPLLDQLIQQARVMRLNGVEFFGQVMEERLGLVCTHGAGQVNPGKFRFGHHCRFIARGLNLFEAGCRTRR